MNVVIAKSSGFCPGVRYAVDTTMNMNAENTFVLGELIHNAVVMQAVEKKGIKTVSTLSEVPDGATVVFRSHGVPENYYEICSRRNIKVVDCTCGFVKRTQKIIKEQYSLNKHIVIVGEPRHPEVVGLMGWCNGTATVLSDIDEISDDLREKELCIVCQTTFSTEKFVKIIKNIKKVCEKTVAVFETICYTTIERQKEVEELAKCNDAILVVGGLNSSNTNKLFEIAKKHCGSVFRLADAEDMDYSKLKKFKSVGIVSGASTPDAQTREVLLKMAENTEGKVQNEAMADVLAKMDNEQQKLIKNSIVKASISQATEEGLQVLLPGYKKEVTLSKDELDCDEYRVEDYLSKIGDTIELLVVEPRPNLKLSQKMIKLLKEEETLLADIEAGKDFTVKCEGYNKGGLTARLGTYTVFVPAKEIRLGYVKDLTAFVGKTMKLRSIEVVKTGKKEIIASRRVILQEEQAARDAAKAEKEAAFFSNIAVGDVVDGKVERVTGFGAFVSVNGFDCLAHISDLSWTGVDAVTDVLTIGETYKFKVLKIDQENKKVSIGYKQLQPKPWDLAGDKYNVGDVVHGKVVRIVPFGAFVEVEKGIDGLVHVSQISHERIETPATCLNVGDEVDAQIVAIDVDARKMNLSIKALLPEPERRPRKQENSDEEEGAPKKTRSARKSDDGEISNWSEGSITGTSIGDLLANVKNKK